MTRFWILSSPKYQSDYRHTYVNGDLEHPFRLPRVRCDICGNTWGKGVRFLPYLCPDSLRSEKLVKSAEPISLIEHRSLQKQLFGELGLTNGIPFVDLSPGAYFQPGYLDIPSIPRADFLWPNDAVLVVSERMKDLFLKLFPTEISAHPLILRKIGNREARLPVPQMESGEPEDVIKYVPPLQDASGVGPYFEIIPRYESQCLPGRQPKSVCSGCGRIETNIIGIGARLSVDEQMWKGQNLFRLATTLAIVATDKARQLILSYKPSNINFTPAW